MRKAFDCAIDLLSRREHGAKELLLKLCQKGYPTEEAQEALANCQRLNYQSDQRYAESLSRTRINQGYGPIKIKHELQSKGIEADLIAAVNDLGKEFWFEQALQVWQKKFNHPAKDDLSEVAKQQRFLLYRGFPNEIVRLVLKNAIIII